MTKADIIERIAVGTGLTRVETEAVLDGFFYTVISALAEGNSVELRGFGSFRLRERAARIARNPQTGEQVAVPAHVVPVFKPAKSFREKVADGART